MGVREVVFVELDVHALEVGDVELLVVFLVGGLYYDLLLGGLHFQEVCVGGVRQVPNAPLEALNRIPAHEDRLNGRIIYCIARFE